MPHALQQEKKLAAESKRWLSLFSQSNAAMKASKLKRREDLLLESLKVARRYKEMQLEFAPGSTEFAIVAAKCLSTSLRELGLAYWMEDRDDDRDGSRSMPYLLEALTILEPAKDPDYKSLFRIYEALCQIYEFTKAHAKYEEVCRKALALKEKQVGQWHPDIISYLQDLAWALEGQGNYKESISLKKDALGICQNDKNATELDLIALKHGVAYATFLSEGMSDMEAVQKALTTLTEDEKKKFTGRVAEELQSLR